MDRLPAACGVLAPTCFVGAWVTAGMRTPGYSPVRDHISDLAATTAASRPLMTAGFVAFGALLPVFGRGLTGPARSSVTVAGLSTLAVAALPVDTRPAGHALAALVAYTATAASPLLLPQRSARARTASYALGAASAAALLASLGGRHQGGWQRLGLTLVDAWYVAVARRG